MQYKIVQQLQVNIKSTSPHTIHAQVKLLGIIWNHESPTVTQFQRQKHWCTGIFLLLFQNINSEKGTEK